MINEFPKVSILVPCYNVEKYIRQCLDSIVNQTLKDIEIICINDGSKDSTLDILREYEANDPRVKVISKRNTGYGDSMNIGLESAKGEYIGIVESDDFVELNMFEDMYNEAKNNDLDVVRSNFWKYSSKTDTNEKLDQSWVKHNEVYAPMDDITVFYQQPSIWANIYKREFLDKNSIRFLPTPGASYQDLAFTFKVYAMAKRFKMIENTYLHYRIDNENSSINSPTKVYCVCDEYDEVIRFSKEKGIFNEVKYLIPHLKFRSYKWNFERLTKKLAIKFLWTWHREYIGYLLKHQIKKRIFGDLEYRKALFIALCPIKYVFRDHI